MNTYKILEISKNKKIKDFSFLNIFWGTKFSKKDKKKLELFIRSHKLRSKRISIKKISNNINIPQTTVHNWIKNKSIPYVAHFLKYYSELNTTNKVISINSTKGGKFIGPWIKVPEKIKNYKDIKKVLNQINKRNGKIELYFAYILGLMVGDASKKEIKRKNRTTRRIQLRLTTKHKTNKKFGEYVSFCLKNLNIRINRTKNCPKGKRNPNDFYAWHSQCSPLIDWIFKVCLGLNENELTSYDKVKMKWILFSPKEFKIKFLQGLSDSDGYIDITQYRAGIVTKPNAILIQNIFNSLNIKSNIGYLHNRTMQQVKIRLEEANKLPLFSPEVSSYRYKLMKRIVKADKLTHHWPEWLGNKINNYLKQNLSSTRIIKSILEEHNIIIRQGGIQKRKEKLKMKKEDPIVLGIESTALE